MEDLICGLTWDQIQAAQQGKNYRVLVSDTIKPPKLNEGDLTLYKKHGAQGLKDMEYFGVLDRLTRCGVIK